MQENFVKLKDKFKVDPYLIKDLRISFGKKVNDTFKGISQTCESAASRTFL